jgi:hypothetical protein
VHTAFPVFASEAGQLGFTWTRLDRPTREVRLALTQLVAPKSDVGGVDSPGPGRTSAVFKSENLGYEIARPNPSAPAPGGVSCGFNASTFAPHRPLFSFQRTFGVFFTPQKILKK